MNGKQLSRRITAGVFVTVIAAFMLLILTQFIIKNILIDALNMDNFITGMSVTGGSDGMISVDWEALYPFKEDAADGADAEAGETYNSDGFDESEGFDGTDAADETADGVSGVYLAGVQSFIDLIDDYSSDYLPFKEYVKVPSGIFDKIIGNKMVDTDNVYIRTGDDGLIVRSPFYRDFSDEELDTSDLVDSVVSLRDYLDTQDIDFMYVQAPIKEDKYDTEYVSTYGLSYESRLADNLLAGLSDSGVDVMDLRKLLYEQGMDCYDAFFVTDNHWNIATAFWASGLIAERLNDNYGFNIDMDVFDMDNYNETVYDRWVQGTIGRSVTLVNADYDDISVYVPKFETNLTIKIPNLNMNKTGDYLETMINPAAFARRSTVYHGAYDAFAYSKPPITEVTNNLIDGADDKSVLLIRESFAGPVITYMSLGLKSLYAVTPEGFTGSIQSYIEQTSPDMVVILYTAPTTNEITSKYDFK